MRIRSWGFVAVSAVALLAVGGVAGWLIATPASPAGLRAAPPTSRVPLTSEMFTDTRTVALAVDTSAGADLFTRTAGVVTKARCSPGAVWSSGDTPLSIDGQPLLVLATSVPLWRDLHRGDHGEDVSALQQELHRLGVNTPTTGTLSDTSWAAITTYLAAKGVAVTDHTLAVSTIVWAPTPVSTIAECHVQAGQRVASDAVVATTAARLSSVAVDPLPGDLVPGTRTLTVGEQTVAVTDDGAVTAAADLKRLAATPAIQRARTATEQTSVTGRLALADPIRVYSVPAGAISGHGPAGCVATPSGQVPVVIVSSTLGRTLVTFPSAPAPDQVLIDPRRPPECN